MAKSSSVYICQQCGFRSSQYLGRCPECGSWNSLVEEVQTEAPNFKKNSRVLKLPEIINLVNIERQKYERLTSGLGEFDRVLGGGIVLGSVVLASGDPGIGKSTLLTQLALNLNLSNKSNLSNVLYVAGEESAQQIKIRVDRIQLGANLSVLNEVDVDAICAVIEQQRPSLVIVDSIQTLQTEDLNSVAGSVGQVRESAHRLQRIAKALHIPIFIVGHVTKEGTVAGPKTLEHMVDVVLSLEGDPASNFRVLRASKNRFGPTDEVGIFEMEETGMVEVKNPSKLFLEQKVDAPGSTVVATMNGLRPLLVEIQALVTKSFTPIPRRTGSGIDNNRLQLLVAVLSKRLGLPLYDQDIFVNVTGGLKVFEPAADLAVCLAIISSFKDQKIIPQTVLLGEVGLLGELRSVRSLDKRASEAKKLGFTNVISPQNAQSIAQAAKLALK
ncbi:MAG: repair protein radA protein [Candidatus Daviesbacteria bacterium GW2011_GWA1_41_61]|uniref:DNA repair protein RadA n=1 Tax=Candidatus Daviesbacteria bacterium GW2011_GWA2_40_9 TaxID=1618424 RepID=A0A0G0X484_9BACT|nr:MAG: repair protein radA protein [Candidatus Daviesbacteria bacterium GW2011_GWA2_40_9]KKR92377.1 MAG: repair protein radA protein [Candidatus Daviesbacteria bacterium GW2011_GWB1_41_15]KKS14565.1 MAG: repair protein radA protein [Candidatus Daviesbacteria bacterium GW2011_GWA1_41_61]